MGPCPYQYIAAIRKSERLSYRSSVSLPHTLCFTQYLRASNTAAAVAPHKKAVIIEAKIERRPNRPVPILNSRSCPSDFSPAPRPASASSLDTAYQCVCGLQSGYGRSSTQAPQPCPIPASLRGTYCIQLLHWNATKKEKKRKNPFPTVSSLCRNPGGYRKCFIMK